METTLKKCRRRSLRNLRRSSSSYVIPARPLLDASTEGGPYCDKISSSPYGSAWLGENTIEKLVNSSNSTPVISESQVVANKIASRSPTDHYDELFVTDRSFKSKPPSLSPASPLNASSLSFQIKEFEDLVDKNQNSDWKPISFQGLFSKKMDAGSEGQTKTLQSKSPKAKIGLNKDRFHGPHISSSKNSTLKIASSTMKDSKGKMKSDMKLSLNYPKNCTLFRNPSTKLPVSESFRTKKDLTVNTRSIKTHKTVFPRSSSVSSSTSLNSFSSKMRHQADLCRPTSQSETEPTDNTNVEQKGLANDKNVKNIIHQISSKLQALQTGMVTNRKLICESKQDREESMLPKKVRRKSEVPDTKRHHTLTFCSKENFEHCILNAEKSKKRKQLSLRKSLPAVRVPYTTITDVVAEKQKSPSSPDLNSPNAMTSEATVYIAEERTISVHSKVESNITDNYPQIQGNELIDNQRLSAFAKSDGYDSGTCDNLDFEMTEELLKSFDLPVFTENFSREPNFDSEKRKKRSLRRTSRHFTLYEMPLSRPSIEAQSESEELSNQNSSSSTSASPCQNDGGHIIVENSSPLNKCTGNKENVQCVRTDIPTQKYQTLFFDDKQTSSEVDKETIEEITENFNCLFVEPNPEVTRSNRAKDGKIKENQRRNSTNIFKACSENINDNFHNDYVISQTYDKTQNFMCDCTVAKSLLSDLEEFQDGSKVNFHNEGYLMSEEKYLSDCSGNQNVNALGDIVMQDIASNEAFCDLKAEDDMDTSEESVPKYTKALRSRKSWDFSQVSVQQDSKVTRRKHKVSETITPSTGHLDKMDLPSKEKFNEEISPGLKELYLNKNFVLPKPKTWETIKENPTNNQSIFTKQKFKRILLFEAGVNASKLQRRQKKAAFLNKGATTRTTISDQDFKKKLLDLDVELNC